MLPPITLQAWDAETADSAQSAQRLKKNPPWPLCFLCDLCVPWGAKRNAGYFTVPCRAALMMASVSMPSSNTLLTMRLASGGR